MSNGNGLLSGLFGVGTAPVRTDTRENLPIRVATDELSPEAIVTSPNFILVDGVLIGAAEITPDMAAEWLTRNVNNVRKFQVAKIGLFVEAMKKGQWDLNGETIKFDREGNLVDGQNRLAACVSAEKSFKATIVWGIESADNVDRGKPRTVGQILQGRGLSHNANVMAAAINFLHAYEDAGSKGFVTVGHGKHPLTVDDAIEFAEKSAMDLNHSIRVTAKTKNLFNKYSLHAALHYLFSQIAGEALADQFYNSLCDGTGLASDSPIYHLRERLLKERTSGKQPQINPYAGLIIKAWNYFICGRHVQQFKYVYKTDGVPSIKRSPLSK